MNNVPIPGSGGGLIARDQVLLDLINSRVSTIEETPTAGTNAIWTLAVGGTPTGGTIRMRNLLTGAAGNVIWSAVNNTFQNQMNTILDTLFGAGNVQAVWGGNAGIGDFVITFSSALGLQPVEHIGVTNLLTGTAPTVELTNTTPGLRPSGYGTPAGAIIAQEDDGTLWVNQGTATSPDLQEISVGSGGGGTSLTPFHLAVADTPANTLQGNLSVIPTIVSWGEYFMPVAGSLRAISATLGGNAAGSDLTIDLDLEGNVEAAILTLPAGQRSVTQTFDASEYPFEAGDLMSAYFTTGAGWTSTSDLLVTLWVALDPIADL